MLLLVLGMEEWACTTECKERQYVDVRSSYIRRWAHQQRHNLPRREWPAKQRVLLLRRESDKEMESS